MALTFTGGIDLPKFAFSELKRIKKYDDPPYTVTDFSQERDMEFIPSVSEGDAVARYMQTGELVYKGDAVPVYSGVSGVVREYLRDRNGAVCGMVTDTDGAGRQTELHGYSGTLEIAAIPDAFRTGILGEVADTNGVTVESSDAPTVEFALLFQFEGDANAVRHCFYRCTCSRSAVNGATVEASITPQTETLNITAMARISDNVVKSRCDETSAPTQYAGWFTTVYEPVL